eukprot:363904-Chlamydomonas_euryale.AAC.4
MSKAPPAARTEGRIEHPSWHATNGSTAGVGQPRGERGTQDKKGTPWKMRHEKSEAPRGNEAAERNEATKEKRGNQANKAGHGLWLHALIFHRRQDCPVLRLSCGPTMGHHDGTPRQQVLALLPVLQTCWCMTAVSPD